MVVTLAVVREGVAADLDAVAGEVASTVVGVVVVVFPVGDVAAVVAHGRVESPNLRVKNTHSIDGCE